MRRIGTVAVFLLLAACASTTQQTSGVDRMYVINCGENHVKDVSRWTPGVNAGKEHVFSNHCYLIRHAQGLDAVGHRQRRPHRGDAERPQRGGRRHYRLHEEAARRVAEGDRRGAADIKHFAMSHAHGDHSGNANFFTAATLYVQRAEYVAMFGPEPQKFGFIAANFDKLRANPAMIIDGDYDVFGDGTVTLKAGAGAHARPSGAGGAPAEDRAGDALGRHGAPAVQLDLPRRAVVQLRRSAQHGDDRRDEGVRAEDRRAALDQPRHGAERQDPESSGVRPMKRDRSSCWFWEPRRPGGGFPLYGEAFAEMVNAQEPRIRVEPRNTKGSAENVPLLEAGKLDLALVAGEFASAALAKPDTPLRVVAAMYSSPGMFIVRGDSPHRSISDLRGKSVVMGTQASGVTALGRTVLESLEMPVKPIFLEKAADGPPMLMDGRAEALWGAGVGWPAFTALAKQGGRFITPTHPK